MYSATSRPALVASGIGRSQPRRACSASTMLSRTREVADDALGLAVLAGEGDPAGRWRRAGVRNRRAVDADLELAGVGAVGAEEQARQLGAPGAEQAGQPDDLARGARRGRRAPASPCGRGRRAFSTGAPVSRGRRWPATSRSMSSSTSSSRPIISAPAASCETSAVEVLADQTAVAQHRHPVGDLVDLVEEVRDEQDRDAAVAQAAHHPEQLGDLVGVQARGRLVEDQHPGVDVDRTGDRDELLDRDRVLAERRGRVDVQVEPVERLRGPAVHRPAVDAAEATGLAAEQDVLGHREVGAEVDLLVDGADAGGLRRGRARRSRCSAPSTRIAPESTA